MYTVNRSEKSLEMIPRIGRRWVSQAVLEKEMKTRIQRTILKAERDERMDITMALTPVKTYMGGFTKPRAIRTSNWWKGGRWSAKDKMYNSPLTDAYEPHTVYLLETRYPTKDPTTDHATTRQKFIVGICREGQLEGILARMNSENCSPTHQEIMDHARWPWLQPPSTSIKRSVWWTDSEDRQAIIRELKGLEKTSNMISRASSKATKGRLPNASLVPSFSPTSASTSQVRAYSARAPPGSADDVVPNYFIERKRQRDAIAERKEQEGDLMYELSAGIISDSVSATTVRKDEKIPTEIPGKDGVLRHASGFVIPTPGEADVQASDLRKTRPSYTETQTSGVRERVEEESTLKEAVDEGYMKAATKPREEKVPVEFEGKDGVVAHPSGFVPPVPNTSFHSPLKNGRGFHSSASHNAMELSGPLPVPLMSLPSPVAAENENHEEEYNGEDSTEQKYGPTLLNRHLPVEELRAQYLPTLSTAPFWRPLFTMTASTRPLANTLVRLSRSLPRGLAFFAAIKPEDRLYGTSFSARERCMRLDRMQSLTVEMAKLLAGYRGGFIGIRFSPEERGRGLNGEGLADPIPADKRVIKVGVGESYRRADDIKKSLRKESEDLGGALDVFGLDEHGHRVDEGKNAS